jgi:hypothetical protein
MMGKKGDPFRNSDSLHRNGFFYILKEIRELPHNRRDSMQRAHGSHREHARIASLAEAGAT